MKLEHARRLQRAIIIQQNARNELISASTDEQTISTATAFMAATEAVCAVTVLIGLTALDDASNWDAPDGHDSRSAGPGTIEAGTIRRDLRPGTAPPSLWRRRCSVWR
jgi:hypothetical protein